MVFGGDLRIEHADGMLRLLKKLRLSRNSFYEICVSRLW